MTLQQMRYAVAIADKGSFNKAAEEMFVAQPSITGAIRELENELEITLFYRTSHGTKVTEEGADFIAYARQIISQTDALLDRFGKGTQTKRKFGVATQHYSFATKAFVELLQRYDAREFEFSICETRTRDVIERVASQKSEIGILYLSDFNRTVLTRMLRQYGLSFHHLIDCDAYVYLWKGHPLAKNKSITFAQLQEYPCLMFEQNDQTPIYLQEEILVTKDYPQIIWANDRATMLNLMIGVYGYTLCSGIVSDELNGGDYVAVAFEGDEENPNCKMEVGYIKKEGLPLSRIGEAYIASIQSHLA